MIKVDNLTIGFNDVVAVNGISFEVQPGESVGILGSNGAGKTSTMKALAGIILPNDGSIQIDGHDLTTPELSEQVKRLTGYCPDVGGLLVGATPREHVELALAFRKREADYEQALQIVENIGLGHYMDTPVGGFSHGESRRLSVALATICAEKVLILDEPFDGVDPLGTEAITELIAEAKRSGLAVIVCTHLRDVLTNVTDRLVVMSRGNILATVDSKSLHGKAGESRYRKLLLTANAEQETVDAD